MQVVEVAYATNRTVEGGTDPEEFFGNEEGPLSLGLCRVEFSPIKLLKNAARRIPIRFPTEAEQIVELEKLEPAPFWDRLKEAAASGKKSLFYVHGYKMDFEKSCRRAALLQREVGPDISVLFFAWPSQDNFAKYTHDATLIRKSVEPMKSVLRGMAAELGDGRSHVVAHSIGTRGAAAAVADLAHAARFDQVVLIAPDMDKQEFERNLPALRVAASGITVYVSENDGPLLLSREFHGEPRLGEAGEYLTLFNGVETVDITGVPRRDLYGHNYHYFNDVVIQDLRELLVAGHRASARPGLIPHKLGDQTYWELTAPDPAQSDSSNL